MNKPIKEIEGKDCEECNGRAGRGDEDSLNYCPYCKGKSPTTLIFKAEDFPKCGESCKAGYKQPKAEWDYVRRACICKGTGLILPKKNEVIETGYFVNGSLATDTERGGLMLKKFRLTSDAEVKRSYEVPEYYKIKLPDKIVICRGYYEK